MLRVRCVVALGAFAFIGACATYPDAPAYPQHNYPSDGVRSAQRPQLRDGPDRYDVGALYLCPTNVTNAPPTDGGGSIAGFTPTLYVSGVKITRAPVKACVSSGFGPRVAGGVGKFHNGIDLYTRTPEPIYAAADGVIEIAAAVNGYGQMVLIDHGSGVKTRYGHLSSYSPRIRKGRRVNAGEAIGLTGSTGNATAVHLHYEIIVDGVAMNPLLVR
jgi:murein DD-endopeptidase MepM/ murein hydrolase activator NlpD